MLYFANPSTELVRSAMLDPANQLGMINTPAQGSRLIPGVTWCADNGCYGNGYPGDERWLGWLKRNQSGVAECRFATAPDVVGDAVDTWQRSSPLLPKVRELGYLAALVAQDGLENITVHWDWFDALFIGGSTEWKLGEAAKNIASEAKARGKWLHMGRVNSRKRYAYAQSIGCDSVDGTYLAFGPAANLPKLLKWKEGS